MRQLDLNKHNSVTHIIDVEISGAITIFFGLRTEIRLTKIEDRTWVSFNEYEIFSISCLNVTVLINNNKSIFIPVAQGMIEQFAVRAIAFGGYVMDCLVRTYREREITLHTALLIDNIVKTKVDSIAKNEHNVIGSSR